MYSNINKVVTYLGIDPDTQFWIVFCRDEEQLFMFWFSSKILMCVFVLEENIRMFSLHQKYNISRLFP